MTPGGSIGDQAPPEPPSVVRRLACLVYEGVLLFGLLMTCGFIYAGLTQQRHALQGRAGLMGFAFLVLAIYFGWFWSRSGQTLAMKTWRLRVVCTNNAALSQQRALVRYLLSWLWWLPGLAAAHFSGLEGGGAMSGILTIGVLAYAGTAYLRPDRQFLHDAVCDTRVVNWPPAHASTSQSSQ